MKLLLLYLLTMCEQFLFINYKKINVIIKKKNPYNIINFGYVFECIELNVQM